MMQCAWCVVCGVWCVVCGVVWCGVVCACSAQSWNKVALECSAHYLVSFVRMAGQGEGLALLLVVVAYICQGSY